ncbi:MAG: hypothetical protein AAGI13_02035 [Pseudomonadota bacterium]
MAVFKKAPEKEVEGELPSTELDLLVMLLTDYPELTMAAGLVFASILFFSAAFEWTGKS